MIIDLRKENHILLPKELKKILYDEIIIKMKTLKDYRNLPSDSMETAYDFIADKVIKKDRDFFLKK